MRSSDGDGISGRGRAIRADNELRGRIFIHPAMIRFLGIDAWVADWCRANRERATRVGLLDRTRTRSRRRR